jgi:hypothetical protein
MRVCHVLCRWVSVFAVCALLPAPAEATEWFVAAGGSGSGTRDAPFGRIQQALNIAQAGDTVTVRPGTYRESLNTVRSGTSEAPISLRAAKERGSVIVTASGRVLTVRHANFTVEGLIIDGQYGDSDTIQVATAGHRLTIRNTEVRRSSRDLIDMAGPTGVVIDNCLIHHALNATNGRTDAHGIAAGPVQNLTIRHTAIHTFSGDGFQVDPGRSKPGWNNVTLDSVRIWLEPLPKPENGFAAGTVPGENGVDTKVGLELPRATLTIRNTTAWGFRNGLIGNMAAFNLKEKIDATLDRITVFDSEIAFRLRGAGKATTGAWVTLKNAVVHDVLTAYRYEDEIQNLRIWNNTIGREVGRAFQAAQSTASGLDVQNLLILGPRPKEAAAPSNMTVGEAAFIDARRNNYRLALGAPAIDTGLTIQGVSIDRNGVGRPVGSGYDVGAYEWQPPDIREVVVHMLNASTVAGDWRTVFDETAAGSTRLTHPDAGAPRRATAMKRPIHYFEVTVPVEAGVPYRLWLRGRADGNSPQNDSVFVQFSSAMTSSGAPLHRIGTSSGATVNFEDCPGCGLRRWSWQDNASGVEVLGLVLRFASSGFETIRVQTREDGVSIDQLVLSPTAYLTASPGAFTDDTTLLPES